MGGHVLIDDSVQLWIDVLCGRVDQDRKERLIGADDGFPLVRREQDWISDLFMVIDDHSITPAAV